MALVSLGIVIYLMTEGMSVAFVLSVVFGLSILFGQTLIIY